MINLRFKWLNKGEQIKAGENEQLLIFHAKRLECLFGDIPIVKISSGINEITTFSAQFDSPTVTGTKTAYIANDEINLALIVASQPRLKHEFFATNYDKIQLADTPHYKGDPKAGDSRRVWQLIGAESGLPFRLGLTVHGARGTWSSTIHKFEEKALSNPAPPDFYEQFAYMTNPKGGWGIQVKQGYMEMETTSKNFFLTGKNFIREKVFIADRSVEQIPLGSHPVTGGPGIQLAYFWVYTSSALELMEKFGG